MMQANARISKNDNCLKILMDAKQTYVRIYNANRQLVRESKSPKMTTILQIAIPGAYQIESDGKIIDASSINSPPCAR